MADANPANQNISNPAIFRKEDFVARAAAMQEQLRQQNPSLPASDLDLKLSSAWWEPMFELSAAVDVSPFTAPVSPVKTYLDRLNLKSRLGFLLIFLTIVPVQQRRLVTEHDLGICP